MAVTAWSQNTAFNVGDIRRPATLEFSGLFFRCSIAGTSGANEPDWAKTVGGTVIDGTCTWVAISSVYEDISKLEPNAIIELFELHLDSNIHGNTITSPVRWHNGCNANITGNISFNGNQYNRIAIEAAGFAYTSTGTAPRPTLTISNTDSLITFLLRDINLNNRGNDLGGAVVRRIRTCKKFLDSESTADGYAHQPVDVYEIDRKVSENRNIVSFELASVTDRPNDFVPKRQLIGNCCQWKYRSAECSYTGSNYFDKNDNVVSTLANDVCGKRLSSCKKRFGENGVLPFGSFPTAGKTQ